MTELEVVRCNAQLTYYQATGSDRSVLYFKHYNEIANSASLEYKLLVRNSDVPFIPRPCGVLYNWKHWKGEPLLVYTYGPGHRRCRTLSMECKVANALP